MREALKLALEALRKARRKVLTTEECHAVIMSIKEALREHAMYEVQRLGQEIQPEQEQQIQTLKRCLFQMQEAAKDLVEQAKSLTPPQRTWVGLTDEEIDQGLLRSDYAFKTAEAWRAGVVFAMTKLKEKNT